MAPSPRIDAVAERSELVRGALDLARDAHAGQVRWTGSEEIPFVEHPLAVAELLAEAGFGEKVLAAGLLHDAVEHSAVRPEELRERFGAEVADLVEALTEDAEIEDYADRKQDLRDRVCDAGAEARALFATDKRANVMVLREAYAAEGEAVDARLPVPLDEKILVWEEDLEMLFAAEEGVPVIDRLADELVGLWEQRATEERVAQARSSSI